MLKVSHKATKTQVVKLPKDHPWFLVQTAVKLPKDYPWFLVQTAV